MSNSRIFICDECKLMAMVIQPGSEELSCGGKPMRALAANITDAAQEKHVPVVTVEGNKVVVKVGSVAHPMLEEHYIQWIYIQTKRGGQYRYLKPGEAPEAEFLIAGNDELVAVYEYCNLHGLWKYSKA